MKIHEFIKQYALQTIATLLVGGIGACVTVLTRDAWRPFVAHVLPAVTPEYLVALCVLLALTNVITIFALFAGRDPRSAMRKRLIFLHLSGVWQDPKTNVYYCPDCLAKNCVAPMRHAPDQHGTRLFCTHCEYQGAIDKKPEPKTQPDNS